MAHHEEIGGMAYRLSMVSSRVSPLAVDERPMSRLMTSAERRLAAISKVVRVRVEFSKTGLKTPAPQERTFSHPAGETSIAGTGRCRGCDHLPGQSLDRQQVGPPPLRWDGDYVMLQPRTGGAVVAPGEDQALAGARSTGPGQQVGATGVPAPRSAIGEVRPRPDGRSRTIC